MAFLPSGYNLPSVGESSGSWSYFKPQEGKNKIRIMSEAIVGWEYWTNENKPVRSRNYPNNTPGIREETKPREFWAVVIWNYAVEEVQIWSFTQATIKRALMAYVEDEDWGDPRGYDISIDKTGSGKETVYTVMAKGAIKSVAPEIKEKVEAEAIDLDEALFKGQPSASDRLVQQLDENMKKLDAKPQAQEKPVDLDTIPF